MAKLIVSIKAEQKGYNVDVTSEGGSKSYYMQKLSGNWEYGEWINGECNITMHTDCTVRFDALLGIVKTACKQIASFDTYLEWMDVALENKKAKCWTIS